MTAIVGIVCRDGVVIGTDGAATFGTPRAPTIEQKTEKLTVIGKNAILAGAGSVGLGQRFHRICDQYYARFASSHPIDVGKELSREMILDMMHTGLNTIQYGALLAFVSDDQPHLCEFDGESFQPEFKLSDQIWYASIGSGQVLTDPFLALIRRVFWRDGPPTLTEGVFATTWSLIHAIDANPGGVNEPISIAVLAKEDQEWKVQLLSQEQLGEHRQSVANAEDHLRAFRDVLAREEDAPELPVLGNEIDH